MELSARASGTYSSRGHLAALRFKGDLFQPFFSAALSPSVYLSIKSSCEKRDLSGTDKIVMLVSLIASANFNSVHIYEIFRLINGASIGTGIVVYRCKKVYLRTNAGVRAVMVVSAVALCCLWSQECSFQSGQLCVSSAGCHDACQRASRAD